MIAALVLPVTQAVLFFVGLLLRAMDDVAGQGMVEWLILIVLVVWAVDLVLLVVALGIRALDLPDDRPEG